MLGRVKKIKNYERFLKNIDLNKYENYDEKREIAVNIIERWIMNSLAKMKVKKII